MVNHKHRRSQSIHQRVCPTKSYEMNNSRDVLLVERVELISKHLKEKLMTKYIINIKKVVSFDL